MPRHSLSRKSISPIQPIAVLATAALILGFFTATESVKASGSGELIGDLSSVCAATGPSQFFGAWANSFSGDHPKPDPGTDSKWGTVSPYTTSVIVATQAGSAANLATVPASKNLSAYVAYPFTTAADTRIVIPSFKYGDSVATAINMQAQLFSISGGTATAVAPGGVNAETAPITTSAGGDYVLETFDFPDTLLASSASYELRVYIWGASTFVLGYDDFTINLAPCLPAPPTLGSETVTGTTVSIPLTAPSLTGASPILNYEYSLDNGSNWQTPSPAVTSSPLDVSGLPDNQAYDIKLRTLTTAGVSVATAGISVVIGNPPQPPAPVSQAPRQVVALVSPDSNTPVPRNRTVSLFGTHFDTVTEVFVGGKKVEMRKKSAYQIEIVIPSSMSGLVDLEIRSPLNNVLSPKHFNLRALGTSSARGAELSVAGFEHNSRKLTKAMKKRINRWLKQNPSMSTLTCTGFTSLPKRATDVVLSTKRGNSVCNFAKRKNPDLEIVIRPGVEDPRPGSKIRRALLVLYP